VSPAPPPACKAPKLAGKKLKAVRKTLSKADCKLGKVAKKKGATSKSGTVGMQSPKAGRVLVPGSKVKVTLKA
jgi:beta-lactam-binding protein with PASTA domain